MICSTIDAAFRKNPRKYVNKRGNLQEADSRLKPQAGLAERTASEIKPQRQKGLRWDQRRPGEGRGGVDGADNFHSITWRSHHKSHLIMTSLFVPGALRLELPLLDRSRSKGLFGTVHTASLWKEMRMSLFFYSSKYENLVCLGYMVVPFLSS